MVRHRLNGTGRHLAMLAAVLTLLGCGGIAKPASTPPVRFHGYVMSAQANAILVVDTSDHTIVARVRHPDLVRPANGKFHPSKKRFYAGGVGKVTIWDTTDLANPVYLQTVTPAAGSSGEYRGVHVYKGTAGAIDGDVYWSNTRDGTVYVYRAADLERANPAPVKVFNTATDGIVGPHYFTTRPRTNEIWLSLRTATASGRLIRIDGDTRTVITTPTATIETTGIPGDEPNHIAFSRDGARAYVSHHGNTITGSPTSSSDVVIVDATAFTVAKTIQTAPGYATPSFLDVDWDLDRLYVATKWSPALVVFDMKTERVLRYIDLGGYGPAYGVYATPDKRTLYLTLGPPAQGALVVVDVKTLTIIANIADTDLNQPRAVRFTHY